MNIMLAPSIICIYLCIDNVNVFIAANYRRVSVSIAKSDGIEYIVVIIIEIISKVVGGRR